jgi:hypothetical protein
MSTPSFTCFLKTHKSGFATAQQTRLIFGGIGDNYMTARQRHQSL